MAADEPDAFDVRRAKAELRARLLVARSGLGPAELAAAAAAVQAHVLAATWSRPGSSVAAYAPVGSEPGSLALLDALVARGVRVLLPVVSGPGLDWVEYDGRLVAGPWWLREPPGNRLGPAAVAGVDAVLVPALAVDRRGNRLGRGAGCYDRSLSLIGAATPLVAVLHDGELLDEPLTVEPHDVPMTAVITPSGGRVELR